MIHVELKGGLGNQLFQYATALSLSKYHGTKVFVDIKKLNAKDEVIGTYRKYKLKNLVNKPIVKNISLFDSFKVFISIKIEEKFHLMNKQIFKEKSFFYDENIWKTKGNIKLYGNFQSYKYFENSKTLLFDELAMDVTSFSKSFFEKFNDISYDNSIAIHIRRGDYFTNKIAFEVLGVLDVSYYKKAIQLIQEKIVGAKFFIFSDDINWARENIKVNNSEIIFICNNEEENDIADFYLMQHCKHNIIANSTFSWWAAYLNPNPNKIVIAPQKWFNDTSFNTKDLFPPNWILM